jgi:hypothetical protein
VATPFAAPFSDIPIKSAPPTVSIAATIAAFLSVTSCDIASESSVSVA